MTVLSVIVALAIGFAGLLCSGEKIGSTLWRMSGPLTLVAMLILFVNLPWYIAFPVSGYLVYRVLKNANINAIIEILSNLKSNPEENK